MKHKHFCQSCSMPLDDPKLLGTEPDGSPNADYCLYCYSNGSFINPDMTLDEMTTRVVNKLQSMQAEDNVIELAVNSLPNLKRWDGQAHKVHIY